jgi:type I restriction enzyme S subunit
MNAETFCEHFATFANAPDGITKLRELILQLALQGKVLPQDTAAKLGNEHTIPDEPGSKSLLPARLGRSVARFIDQKIPYELPPQWEWASLGQIAELENGDRSKNYPNKSVLVQSGVPFINAGHLRNGEIDMSEMNYISEDRYDLLRGGKIRPNDLLFCLRGSLGKCATVGKTAKGAIASSLVIVRPDQSIEPAFLLKYFASPLSTAMIRRFDNGTAQPNLSAADLKRFLIPLPPLAEQRRIVEKVDQLLGLCDELAARQAAQREKRQRLVGATLDRLVATRNPAEFPTHSHRLRNHFNQLFDTPTSIPKLRQTILQLAVQGQLVPQDSNDEPVSEFLQSNDQERHRLLADGTIRTKSSNDTETVRQSLDDVPAGWEKRPLTELCQFIDYRGRTPTRTSDGVRLITAKNVRMGAVENEPVEFVSEKQYAQWMTRGFPEVGDLLFVTEGHTMGFVGMLQHTFRFALAQRTINLHPFIKDFNRYLFYYLMSPRFQSDVVNNSTGSAAKGIKASKLKQLLIAVPPLAEQKRIVTKVTELLSLCDALEAKLTQAESASTQLLSAAVHHLLNPAT